MMSDDLSRKVAELYRYVEDLRKKDISDPGNAFEIISEALAELEERLKGLSLADEELCLQSEEHAATQEALWLSAEEIMLVADGIPILIAYISADLHFLFVNQSYAYWLNRPRSEIIGLHMSEVLPKQEYETALPYFRETLSGKMTTYDHIILKDGQTRALNVTLIPGRGDSDVVEACYVIIQDITERKKAEEFIRYRSSLIESVSDAIISTDEDFAIRSWNKAAETIYGWREDEVAGKPANELLQTRYLDGMTFIEMAEQVIESDTWVGEAIQKKKDATDVSVLSSVTALKDVEGNFVGAVAVNRDITERKQMEEDLHEAHEKLEQKVLERTAELSQAKKELETINEELRIEIREHKETLDALLKAKDEAESAARAKSDFMANMSHEIRTPMNAVIGMTSILLDDGNLNPEQKDFIETIRINGDALMVIINDILDFSKIGREKVVLEEQPFELRANIEEALDLVSASATQKGLILAYTIDKDVSEFIIGDPTRLRQILGNLLNNAVKFTEWGEIELSVRASKDDTGTHEIHFAVRDTGIGISAEQIGHLFQPFAQVDATVTRKYGGTGLGLAISRRLVELMGGRIWVESLPGKGSTFNFTIRAETVPDGRKTLAGVPPQLVGKRVLIVDDNSTIRRILGAYLYSWGMSPLIAASGKDALGWIQRGDKFDVTILDMSMPEMIGLALAKEIRNYDRDMPLVVLTNIGQRIDSDFFDASLLKPITPSQLRKVLTNTISLQMARKTARPNAGKKEIQINPLRILLAEDNVSGQKVALQILMRLGYKADVVANGIEVLQALERQPYDLVLMDVRMPEMDGLEATRIIRQRWPGDGPKIIAVTAYALQGDREKCLEAGMDDYISKPVKMAELAEVLRRYQTSQV
jgi:PAS domain S-box-containing protein